MAAACGDDFTAVVTECGELWAFGKSGMYSCGLGQSCALGHKNENDKWIFTRIKAQYFDKKKIVSAATGYSESNETSHSLAGPSPSMNAMAIGGQMHALPNSSGA